MTTNLEGVVGGEGATNTALKKASKDVKFSYQEFDDDTLEHLSRNLGFDESPSMAKELVKFYMSLVQPDMLFPGGNGGDDIFLGLPVWLYPVVNSEFDVMRVALNEPTDFVKIMPDWYLDYYRQKMDVQLVNSYVVWMMDNYYGNMNDPGGQPNPVRQKWFKERFPWIEVERRKTYYMINRIRNKLVELTTRGLQGQGDLLFIYFSKRLFRNVFGLGDNNIPLDFRTMFRDRNPADLLNFGPRDPSQFGLQFSAVLKPVDLVNESFTRGF